MTETANTVEKINDKLTDASLERLTNITYRDIPSYRTNVLDMVNGQPRHFRVDFCQATMENIASVIRNVANYVLGKKV